MHSIDEDKAFGLDQMIEEIETYNSTLLENIADFIINTEYKNNILNHTSKETDSPHGLTLMSYISTRTSTVVQSSVSSQSLSSSSSPYSSASLSSSSPYSSAS